MYVAFLRKHALTDGSPLTCVPTCLPSSSNRRGRAGLRYRIHTPTRSSKLALLLPLAFAILITYQTMRTPAPFEHGGAIEQSGSTQEYTCRILLELLNTASVVYVTCSRVGGKTLSIRRLTIFFAAYEASARVQMVWLERLLEWLTSGS